MAFNLKIEGNFISVTDTDTGGEIFRATLADATFIVDENDVFNFLRNFTDLQAFNFDQIIDDRTGIAFVSVDDLKTFLSTILGVNSCAAGAVTLDGEPLVSVPSGGTVDVELVDQNGSTITPTSISSGVITVGTSPPFTSAPILKTGAVGDLQGREVDEFTLDGNNIFGNNRIFTGVTGGYYDRSTTTWRDVNGNSTTRTLAYPNNLICDWSTLNHATGEFLLYVGDDSYMISPLAAANVTLSTATIGAFTGFRVANINEAQNVQRKSLANSLGYPELYNVAYGFVMHTSTPTTPGVNHTVVTYYGTTSESNSLSSIRCMVVKTINISDI